MKDFPWIFIIEVPENAFFYKLAFLRNKCNIVSASYPYHPLIFNKFKQHFSQIKPFKLEDFREFKNILNKVEPDLILVFEVRIKFNFSKVGCPKAYYAKDPHVGLEKQLRFVNFEEFDYIFVSQKDYRSFYENFGAKIIWLPHACDPIIHKGFNLPYKYDACFIGSLFEKPNFKLKLLDRAWKLKVKRTEMIKEILRPFNAFIGNAWLFDMTKIYSESKIILNKSLKGDLNMRVFEAMASGNLLLTDKIDNGCLDLFKERKHLETYSTIEEAREKIDYYLENENLRKKIAKNGQREVLKHHTYDERVKKIRKIVKI